MQDVLARTLIFNDEVSLAVLDATDLVREGARLHKTAPAATVAFGKILCIAAYMASGLKSNGEISFSLHGNGSLGNILVSADAALKVRGAIDRPEQNPLLPDGSCDFVAAIGNEGYLKVIRDDGEGMPFTGTSEILRGNPDEDFMGYYLKSEQLPTLVNTAVVLNEDGSVAFAGGIFLQPLPGASEEALNATEQAYNATYFIGEMLAHNEDGTRGDYLERLVAQFGSDAEVAYLTPKYHCRCSRDYIMRKVLVTLPRTDFDELIAEDGKICIHCNYCNRDYIYTAEDAAAIYGEANSANETGNPGANETGNPGAGGTGNPGANETGNPGANETGNPSANDSDNPGAGGSGNPGAGGSDGLGEPESAGNPSEQSEE